MNINVTYPKEIGGVAPTQALKDMIYLVANKALEEIKEEVILNNGVVNCLKADFETSWHMTSDNTETTKKMEKAMRVFEKVPK